MVVDVTLGSESVSATTATTEDSPSGPPLLEMEEPSSFGEQVVELASPFSTAGGRLLTAVLEDGVTADVMTVHVETVLVVETLAGRTVAATVLLPVDFRVGVTVADGLVNAVGLPSLSTRGLIGMVAQVAGVPALLGNGRGTANCCCCCCGCGCSSVGRGAAGVIDCCGKSGESTGLQVGAAGNAVAGGGGDW